MIETPELPPVPDSIEKLAKEFNACSLSKLMWRLGIPPHIAFGISSHTIYLAAAFAHAGTAIPEPLMITHTKGKAND